MLAANLLQVLELAALPTEMATMRPKVLRFHLLNVAGRVVRHARRLRLILAAKAAHVTTFITARSGILALVGPPA